MTAIAMQTHAPANVTAGTTTPAAGDHDSPPKQWLRTITDGAFTGLAITGEAGAGALIGGALVGGITHFATRGEGPARVVGLIVGGVLGGILGGINGHRLLEESRQQH